ncbi:MAG: PilZ domain-containing protein [Gammaproteobacteria bacterium]
MIAKNFIFSEKRSAVRYPVVFRVHFDNGEGWTRDISTTGACIETKRKFYCGAKVRFVLNYPGHQNETIRIACCGIVVRTEQQGESWRIAVFMGAIRFDG